MSSPGRGRRARGRTAAPPRAPASPEEERKQALQTAMRALARRGLTAAELEARLAARGFGEDAVAAALSRLRDLGALDEGAVADAVVREATRRLRGSRHVARVLARRGVPDEAAEVAVRASRDADLAGARALLAKRFPGGPGLDPRSRARALRMLVARGYPPDVAYGVLGGDGGD